MASMPSRSRCARWSFIALSCSSECPFQRSEEHTSELQSQSNLVCRLLLEKKNTSELQSHSNLVCRPALEQKTRASRRPSVRREITAVCVCCARRTDVGSEERYHVSL